MSRVNLGMGGFKKKAAPKKKAMKSKGSAQGVKMKSKGGAMGGKKDLPPGMMNGGMAEKDKKKKMGMKSKGYALGGKVGMAPPPKMKPGTGGASRPMPSAPSGPSSSMRARKGGVKTTGEKTAMKNKRIRDAAARGAGKGRGRRPGGI